MRKIKAVLIGAGGRGRYAYGPYAKQYPAELQFVAVAEPDPVRRELFANEYGIEPDRMYADWKQLLGQEKLADAAIICTQDRMHFEPTISAMERGYHVLLEKPMSPSPEECQAIGEAAKKYDRHLTICHVLRYTQFWSTVKRVLSEGKIGKVVSMQLNENVGYFHMAHSFVRGLWRNSEDSSPMILAKSCHDMDVISWIMEEECIRVNSYGSLSHFKPENAPAGSTARCTDGCPVESNCPYSAVKIYMSKDSYPWARFLTQDLSQTGIYKALQEGPFGRCVYRCDNNVVDHQVVNMEFANGSTASFHMSGFTNKVNRTVQIMGTHGEIVGDMELSVIRVYPFGTNEEQVIQLPVLEDGHGGGDIGIMREFLKLVRGEATGQNLTSAEASVQSHMMAFAAEQSRLQGGASIRLSEFTAGIMKKTGMPI